MTETVRIEIPIETIDDTADGLETAVRGLKQLEQAYRNASEAAKKSEGYVTQFDRQAQKTEKSLANWTRQKYEILLEARDKISPVLSVIGNGIRNVAGRTWNVTMKAVDFVTAPLRGIINLLQNPVFQAGAVLGISIGFKDTIDTYKEFESVMSKVKAISGANEAEFEKLTEKAKKMGAATKFTAAESAEAFNYMAMAGWKTEDMLEGIEGVLQLSAASGENLASTSDIVTDSLTAFNMKASEAGRFSDVLAAAASNSNTSVSGMGETFKYAGTMAGSLKYSIEDVSLATGLMANSGIKGTMAGTALNSIFTRLSTNTGGAADAMSELGIEIFTSEGNARDLSDVMEELRAATAGMTAEQKSQIANTIAGTEAQKGLLAIINASEKDYNKLADAINNSDGAAERMSETMMDNLQGSLTLLQSSLDGVKISFGKRLSPYVRQFAKWLKEQMPAIEQGMEDFMDWIDMKVDKIKSKIDEVTSTQEWADADFFGKVNIVWDEFIAEPFAEWWSSRGKAKFAGFARDIGEGIGTGIKVGIMALLGIDVSETIDEGISIGASFAKGFSDGLDFSAIGEKLWQGMGNMFTSAGKFLPGGEAPDLSSFLSLAMLGKIGTPVIGLGRGAYSVGKGLFGTNPETGTSLVGSFLGSAGLRNMGATMGMTGLNLGSGAATGTGLIAAGTTATAGGIVGGASLIHGIVNLYTGLTAEDEEKAKAYKRASALNLGGVASGAIAGASLGSVIPGLGTAVGALAGAGIGGIAGWITGDIYEKRYKNDMAEMEREAERAQKIFEYTGLSIEDAVFKNKELMDAMNDSEISAEEVALMFQEEFANSAKKAFGDITLSLAEVRKLAGEITFGEMTEGLNEFTKAASDTEASLNNLKSASSTLKKENWKVSLGMELSETDRDGYKATIDNFIKATQTYIDDSHYEAVVALKLIGGDEVNTAWLDSYYGRIKEQIENLGQQMDVKLNVFMEDGIITIDEKKELENLQSQLTEITEKFSNAKLDAGMKTLEIKYNGAALAPESFEAMQEELRANVEEASGKYEEALTLTITNLNLQLEDGAITQQQYDDTVREATEKYYAQVGEINARVKEFNLNSIAEAWNEQLDGIAPDIEGTTAEKLSKMLDDIVLQHPDIESWTEGDFAKWMGLDKLDGLDSSDLRDIYNEFKMTALAMPKGTKEQIIEDFKQQIPSAQEIKDAIDWDQMTGNDWNSLMESITGPTGPGIGMSAEDAAKPMAEYYGEYFEKVKQFYSEALHNALEDSGDNDVLSAFMEKYMKDATGKFDFDNVMKEYGPISNEYYSQLVSEWKDAGTAYGDALNEGASNSLMSGSGLLRSSIQTALDAALSSPFAVSPTINLSPKVVLSERYGFGIPALTPEISKHAAGGYVGSPQLSLLAEEGYGEFVIPTNPSRRSRALELYAQAGTALGIHRYAEGGFSGGHITDFNPFGYNLIKTEENNAPFPYIEPTTDSNDSGKGDMQVQVNVSVSPEFVIQGQDHDEESIIQTVRRHIREIADEMGGELAEKLEEVFSNMPLKEA